jgi:hypothetical protein
MNGRGPTNGRVNGRGFTNGRVNGRGITNGRVNGRGITNGRGRINGRGLTNGGLVNGRSGVNGRGLVNGRKKGLVNGGSLVNGSGLVNGRRRRGLVNGNGLVDGNGFIDGRGLVNGKGLINGQGLTNGKQQIAVDTVPARPKVRRNVALAAAAVAVALLIIVPVLYYTQIQHGIAIDGIFDDWKGVGNQYPDGDAVPSPSDSNIDITNFGASAGDTDLFLYVKVAGSMLKGDNNGVDTLDVFIDVNHDGNGYRVNSPGGVLDADLKLEVFGYDGAVRGASYSKWEGSNPNDYGGWASLGAARAAAAGSELEASVWYQGTDLNSGSEASILFFMHDSNGEQDYSDFTIGMNTGVLAVTQRDPAFGVDGGSLMLEVNAYGKPINMTSLTVSKLGNAGGGTVSLSGAGLDVQTGFGGQATFAGFVLPIHQDTKVLLTVTASGMSGTFGMYIAGPTSLTATTGQRPVHVSVSGYSNTLVNLGGVSAGNIVIDGAFEDWEATRGSAGFHSRLDGPDDVEAASSAGSPGLLERGGLARYDDPNINLQEVAEYDSGGSVFYYARVSGQALGGQIVPATKRALPGPSSITNGKQPGNIGSDVFYVLIDQDGDSKTGFPVYGADNQVVMGAEYCAMVAGKNGQWIPSASKVFRWQGGWVDAGLGLSAAAGGRKLELAVVGIALAANHKALAIAEDWTENADRLDQPIVGNGRGRDTTVLTAGEVDISHHAVMVGTVNNPMFRMEMAADGGPISVTGIEIQRDGTAPDSDITGVHLTMAAGASAMPSRTDRVVAGAVGFVNGTARFSGEPLFNVTPGETAVLFVSIDVSPTAELDSTFGAGVFSIKSSAKAVEIHIAKATKDVIFSRTGGRGTNQVVLNEVAKASGNVDWIEIWNPTASQITDWTVSAYGWYWGGDPPGQIWGTWTYTITSLDAGKYVAISPSYTIPWGNTITLKDSGGTQKDTVTPNSISDGHSWARYVDTDGNPMDPPGNWFDASLPTKEAKNPTIPEFSDIMFPLIGIIAVFVVLRNTGGGRVRRKRRTEFQTI